MSVIHILWLDLRRQDDVPAVVGLVSPRHTLSKIESARALSDAIRKENPDVACVEFDYPDEARFSVVPTTVQQYPDLPILMFTEYHSEALALRAFRCGVWDYRVKPVGRAILERSIQFAARASTAGERRTQRTATVPANLVAAGAHLGELATTTMRTAAAAAYIAKHCAEPIDRQSMATRCHLSVSEFSRVFRREHGRTFERFLVEFRIGRARELLETSRLNIMQVADATGFNDSSYFARVFKQMVGVSASDWRKQAPTAA